MCHQALPSSLPYSAACLGNKRKSRREITMMMTTITSANIVLQQALAAGSRVCRPTHRKEGVPPLGSPGKHCNFLLERAESSPPQAASLDTSHDGAGLIFPLKLSTFSHRVCCKSCLHPRRTTHFSVPGAIGFWLIVFITKHSRSAVINADHIVIHKVKAPPKHNIIYRDDSRKLMQV